ncbi:MAG: rRNA maturation RNase YbeY [Planctomycetota bacterium]
MSMSGRCIRRRSAPAVIRGLPPVHPIPIRAIRRLLACLRRRGILSGRVNLLYVDRRAMRALNRSHTGGRYDTDVLSFPWHGEDGLQGEIAVSVDRAAAEARRRGYPASREILLYTLHGILHLAGYDDVTPRKAVRMRRAEDCILEELGVRVDPR